ncbi:MAG TPA: phosphoribosyltransferase family protein [Solirubrobacterales bacterium]|nr:phosphoribosyltransferase family protein [Solirubrobacterales bacterium]
MGVGNVRRLAVFADRRDAGRRLAVALERFRGEAPLVVALPRGGVPVAYEIARALRAPLDILLVRKLGAPHQPEYGIGAIAEGGVRFIRSEELELTGVGEEELERVITAETAELERRRRLYRREREPLPVVGRTVILVDDGIATGGTAIVAAQALKERGAARVVLAVPVAPPGAEERLAERFDEVICLEEPHGFFGVGQFYVDFNQVGDEEVARLLDGGDPADADAGDPPGDPALSESSVEIEPAPGLRVAGNLRVPEAAAGLVIFAHGSGSGRLSPRNRQVAEALNEAGFATLLFDLLTNEEELDRANVFDIGLLSQRLLAVTQWSREESALRDLPVAYFGASTGAAAALRAAARLGDGVSAVVSRGGRPDLAGQGLEEVVSPTLLIVGGADWQVLALNEEAAKLLRCRHEIAIVPGATHLFEEPGALERVAALAAEWFARWT